MIYLLQYILPHTYINKLAHFLANCKTASVKNLLISYFLKHYQVNLQEAIQPDPFAYKSYNDFFTRQMLPLARVPDADPSNIISPVDGTITQYGTLTNDSAIKAKDASLNLEKLFAYQEPTIINNFSLGKFVTIYLAPHNYHRIHMPIDAILEKMIYIPGKLFSVNTDVVKKIPDVFTKNERVIAIFNSNIGKIAIVLIGAMIVGNIVTSWHGEVNSIKTPITTWDYIGKSIKLTRFQEMGLFKLGSTVILLLENNNIKFFEHINVNNTIKVGEKLAYI